MVDVEKKKLVDLLVCSRVDKCRSEYIFFVIVQSATLQIPKNGHGM